VYKSLWGLLANALTAAVGIVMLSAGVLGFLWVRTVAYERVLLLLGAVLLIFPGGGLDAAGLGALAVVLVSQWWRRPAGARLTAPASES
jgi:TRAP-type uncharacterized transport system fused permease subunit